MAPNALSTLAELLSSLNLPITLQPTSLPQIPPSLLQLLLSRILHCKLPTLSSEIETVKLVLGTLVMELPDLELDLVRPSAVVRGETEDLEVVVLALAVLARRRGAWTDASTSIRSYERRPSMREEDLSIEMNLAPEGESSKLQVPIEPDVSFIGSLPSPAPPLAKEQTLLEEMVDTLGLDPRTTIVTRHTAPERHARDVAVERERLTRRKLRS